MPITVGNATTRSASTTGAGNAGSPLTSTVVVGNALIRSTDSGTPPSGAAITATVDLANSPPRIALSVSGFTGDSTVTIVRVDASGNQYPVRTGNPATLASGTWVGYDYEAAFGQPVTYLATGGNTATTALSSVVTLNVTTPWLIHPGIPALSQPLDCAPLGDRTRATNQGVFTPLGRADAVTISDGVRRSPTYNLTVYTHSLDEEAGLLDLLADSSVLLLQMAYPNIARTLYEWVAIGDVGESSVNGWFGGPDVAWTLPCTVSAAPTGLLQAQWTLGGINAAYATLGAINAAYATLGGVATNTPGT